MAIFTLIKVFRPTGCYNDNLIFKVKSIKNLGPKVISKGYEIMHLHIAEIQPKQMKKLQDHIVNVFGIYKAY